MSEFGNLTREQTRIIVSEPNNTAQYFDLINILSSTIPDADYPTLQRRSFELSWKRIGHESIDSHIEKEIIPSEKESSEWLNIKPLITLGVICSDEWKLKLLQQENMDTKAVKREEDPIIKKELLQMAIDDIRNQMGEEKFLTLAHEIIRHTISKRIEKAKTSWRGRLTHGVEIEILGEYEGDRTLSQIRKVDKLQEIGIPITYDGIREIPLPKSDNIKQQLQAIFSIVNAGLIRQDQEISVHYTLGNIEKFDSEFFVLEQICEAANVFEEKRQPGQRLNVNSTPQANKHLYERHEEGPVGLPFRVRKTNLDNGVVVEYRWSPGITNLNHLARGLETISLLAECMNEYQRSSDGLSYNEQLANAWIHLKSTATTLFEQNNLESPETNLQHLTSHDDNSQAKDDFPEANEYAERIANIITRTTPSKQASNPKQRAINNGLKQAYEKTTQFASSIKKAVISARGIARKSLTA